MGLITSETVSADEQKTNYLYDAKGRKWATIGAAVQIDGVTQRLRSETVYNAKGQVWKQLTNIVQFANGSQDRTQVRTTIFEYDVFGNLVKTTLPDGSYTTATYDDLGRKETETDAIGAGKPTGNTKAYEYDTQGRLTAVVLPEVPDPTDLDSQGQPILKNPLLLRLSRRVDAVYVPRFCRGSDSNRARNKNA